MTAIDSTRRFFARVAAAIAAGVAVMVAIIAWGLFPSNSEWIPAWSALGALYAVTAVGLWRLRRWSRWFALGLGLWGLVCFVQSSLVVGTVPLIVAGVAVHAGFVAALLLMPGFDGELRQGRLAFSMVTASAAVPCAAIYGLAPQNSLGVAAGVLGGALAVAAGAWGVCRGRTWGLLAGIGGALIVAVTVADARHAGWLLHPHPLLPSRNPLALLALGIAAAALALLSTVPFWSAMARVLRRGS